MANTNYQYQQQPQPNGKIWGHIETEKEKEEKKTAYELAAKKARDRAEMERTIRLCTAIASSIIITQERLGKENETSGETYAHLY